VEARICHPFSNPRGAGKVITIIARQAELVPAGNGFLQAVGQPVGKPSSPVVLGHTGCDMASCDGVRCDGCVDLDERFR
jgi:hypothetical protein